MWRCAKRENANSNIRYDRFPELYSERAVQEFSSSSPTTVAIDFEQRIWSTSELRYLCNDDTLRQLLCRRIDSIGDGNDITVDAEIALVVKLFKIEGQHSFDTGNDKVLVICDGDKCESFYMKKNRVNVSVTCKRCTKGQKYAMQGLARFLLTLVRKNH